MAEAKATTKFYRNLTSSDASVKGKRADLVAKSAKRAQETLVNKLEDEYSQLEMQQEKLGDIFPDTTVSLKVAENFDADKWAQDMQNVKVGLLNKAVEVTAAKETLKEWFVEAEETPANA